MNQDPNTGTPGEDQQEQQTPPTGGSTDATKSDNDDTHQTTGNADSDAQQT